MSEQFTVTLRPLPSPVPIDLRLREALKLLLRRCRLRCIEVRTYNPEFRGNICSDIGPTDPAPAPDGAGKNLSDFSPASPGAMAAPGSLQPVGSSRRPPALNSTTASVGRDATVCSFIRTSWCGLLAGGVNCRRLCHQRPYWATQKGT